MTRNYRNERAPRADEGMSNAEFRRMRRNAVQEKTLPETPDAGEVEERLRLLKETGSPYRPEEGVYVAIRDGEILRTPPEDSRDKTLLREAQSRVTKALEKADKAAGGEFLNEHFDVLVGLVEDAYQLEQSGRSEEAMAALDEINRLHTKRVLDRDRGEVLGDATDDSEVVHDVPQAAETG